MFLTKKTSTIEGSFFLRYQGESGALQPLGGGEVVARREVSLGALHSMETRYFISQGRGVTQTVKGLHHQLLLRSNMSFPSIGEGSPGERLSRTDVPPSVLYRSKKRDSLTAEGGGLEKKKKRDDYYHLNSFPISLTEKSGIVVG